jgi:hypothetical protein
MITSFPIEPGVIYPARRGQSPQPFAFRRLLSFSSPLIDTIGKPHSRHGGIVSIPNCDR